LVDSTFAGYERNTEITTIIDPSITKFGSDLTSITIVSKTGKEFVCTQDNTVTYTPEERIDKVTTDDFRFGTWYYNAKQLKEYADTNNIPVFLEFSSANCEPCKDFKQNTFNNASFQSAVKQKKCLLCRVELEGNESWSTPNTQPYFCVNSWGDSRISIPQTVYYWKKSDGTTTKQAYWYNYRTDPVNSTYQTILLRIDQLTASYIPDSEMNLEKPEIVTIEEKKSFKYVNQGMDQVGRFFICDSRTRIDTITVNGGITMEGKTENTLTEGEETTFPSGYTYMWYYPQTDYMYDRQGLVFRVDGEGKIEYLYRFTNEDVEGENYERPADDYSTGTVYEMTQDTPSSSLEALIEQAKSNQSQLNIFKLGSSEESERIRQLVKGQDFQNYSNGKDMLFLIVQDTTDSWTANAPLYLKQFQTIPQEKQADPTKVFEPATVHDKTPCLMVYEGCSHCTVDGSTIEYQKDNYDLTGKDLTYIRSCIDINSEEET
jgi:predicted transcriptional regulator